MPDNYWKQINFVGHMESLEDDAKRLLVKVGAWDEFGKSGWGTSGNQSIFQRDISIGRQHATHAADHLKEYITSKQVEQEIEAYYANDYLHPIMNISKITVIR